MKGAETGEFIDTIERHAIRLSRLVEDLLSLSVLETVEASSSEQIALGPFVREFAQSIEPLVRSRNISLELRIGRGIKVRAESALLRQVLQCLGENAIKYSHLAGRVVIEAGVRGGEVVVAVADRDIGIPQKDLTRVFVPFYRTQGARLSIPRGRGSTLSIAHKIVESFGGRIWAEYNAGKGSQLSFTLPLA